MTNNLEIVNVAVTLIIKAAILAARFSGRARKRSLKRLSKMDADTKDKELLFRDKVNQQQMQITILQKGLQKKHTNKRYTLREKLFILCYMETFDIPRRRVTEYLGIAKSTLYRWLHKIEEQQQSSTPHNKTPMEIALLVWEITKANVSWGRVRIANQLALLNIFLAASTCGIFSINRSLEQVLKHQLSQIKCKIKFAPSLPGIQITFGPLTPPWLIAGGFGLFMFVLSSTISPEKLWLLFPWKAQMPDGSTMP